MLQQVRFLTGLTTFGLLMFGTTGCGEESGAAAQTAQPAQTQTATEDQPNKEIFNYIAYSPTFASAGQPTAEQLNQQQQMGVERVVYLAFSDQERSLPAEDRVVKELSMSYLQVPVDWKAPQKREYDLFAAAMNVEPDRKTLLHCQANFRASAFALLYRVLELGVPLGQAKADMNAVWIPNSTWTNFILEVLTANSVRTDCSACDWTPSTIGD